MQLASPLPFGSTIAPVTLPEFNQPIVPGLISKVSGWGDLTEGGDDAPTQLQVVEVPPISLEGFRKAFGGISVTERMVCPGLHKGDKNVFQVRSLKTCSVNISRYEM